MIFKELLFPRRCPVCDRPAPFGKDICPACQGAFVKIRGPVCFKCGKHLQDQTKEYCNDCQKTHHLFERGLALYEYNSVSRAMYGYKFSGRAEFGQYFGRQMAIHFAGYLKKWQIQAIVPVPLHKKKLKVRGYNQAYLLAKSLSDYTGIPIYDKLIIRQRNTKPMKELDPKSRQINLKNAFIMGRYDVKLQRVVIVDDIYTTGATIDAMSKVLKDAGADRIYFLTLSIGRGL